MKKKSVKKYKAKEFYSLSSYILNYFSLVVSERYYYNNKKGNHLVAFYDVFGKRTSGVILLFENAQDIIITIVIAIIS
jgi:hypothetical protein